MRTAAIASFVVLLAATIATPSVAFERLALAHRTGEPATQITLLDRDDFRRSYRDKLFALRSIQTGACGFGRGWYPFPTMRPGGFFESPGPCRYRKYRKRYR